MRKCVFNHHIKSLRQLYAKEIAEQVSNKENILMIWTRIKTWHWIVQMIICNLYM